MSKQKVIDFFKEKNYKVDIVELKDSSTVVKAADELGVNTNDIAKTLSFIVNNKPIVIVMNGDSRINNQKFKEYFKEKAKMISFEEVEELIGHPAGGVCPFGLNNIKIYIDESLRSMECTYPAAGTPSTALKIKVVDMQKLTDAIWIDVCN
jgi:prolyl-tRNA editing enzyme YbaK/EbsC (Cys-tRNA(Pro) deacylase)